MSKTQTRRGRDSEPPAYSSQQLRHKAAVNRSPRIDSESMSGHSKWSTIKHKKAATDAKRGKLFTKLLREVTISARLGGGDPGGNPRLRAAIQDAKANNVPSENLERAIKKGTGELEGSVMELVSYEGYASGGVAVLVEAATDNRNRTAGEIRHIFSRYGGSLGEAGCVNWMFQRRGYFVLESDAIEEEAFMELALELDVEDFNVEGGQYEIFTSLEDFERVSLQLEERDLPQVLKELSMIPQSVVELEQSGLRAVLNLLEALEEQDDVQNVWANFDIDPSVLAQVSAAS